MRTTYALLFIFLLTKSINLRAQSNLLAANSYVSIQKLADARTNFNKSLIKSRTIKTAILPQSRYIFNQTGSHTINVEGLNFIVKDKTIVAIQEIVLSKAALNTINERLMILDKMQFAYCERSNQEYLSGEKNTSLAFNNDRQFFSVLKNIKNTINNINKFSKDDQNTASIELSLAKWKQPKIDWDFYCEILEKDTKTQLSK
ncbi:hypothetical protein EV200_10211 [Pedobacter psychrotolerans]|uniref:Uncharacterized protein n=1 Tax=Pedobacter psychrotolerans TaxID=1843235 RepID=A0A4R2HHC6_9SPHI|nr:hypothetical protein [Pedobacter psychrotolerans]TCO28594.1 hypothetical protein EV200_10211 [Pedobacter psychrotolerans]GGE50341.1 hypothetical protein GCM10011413_15730 [Pedobacter psychrotolerans]